MSRSDGHPKLHCLGSYADIDLTAIVPDRMCFYGSWAKADPSEDPAFNYVVGAARGQWIRRQWYLMFYPWALAKAIRAVKPNLVDVWHEPWSLVSAQTVWLTRRHAPSATIVIETEQNVLRSLPPPFSLFQRYVLRRADAVLARSVGAADVVRRKGFRGHVSVIGNGVDIDLFHPGDREAARHRIGLDGFLVGYVGRLVVEKGVLDLVDALAACPDDVQLVLVGSGPAEGQIRPRAASAGVADRVHVLAPRPRAELSTVMNAIDVLALVSHTTPTWKEQFGRVIVEAHACATPVIGSDSGAIPDVIGAGGMIVPEGDVPAIARALLDLRNNRELARRLGCSGRRQVEERWSWARVAEQTRSLYLEAAAGTGDGLPPPPNGLTP